MENDLLTACRARIAEERELRAKGTQALYGVPKWEDADVFLQILKAIEADLALVEGLCDQAQYSSSPLLVQVCIGLLTNWLRGKGGTNGK